MTTRSTAPDAASRLVSSPTPGHHPPQTRRAADPLASARIARRHAWASSVRLIGGANHRIMQRCRSARAVLLALAATTAVPLCVRGAVMPLEAVRP